MPTQTLIKKLPKASAETIISKTPGAAEQIELEDAYGGCLVKCKANAIGANTHESAPFASVIQDVADAETKLVMAEATENKKKDAAKAAAALKAKREAAVKAERERETMTVTAADVGKASDVVG